MALDVGDVRIGVAVSDLMGIIANPLETYTRKGNLSADAQYVADLAQKQQAELIVSGLPLGLDGCENTQTGKTREFIEELCRHTDVPVKFMDERFTTLSAERVLIQGNVRRENRKKVIDKVAATIILQNYLDNYDLADWAKARYAAQSKKAGDCVKCGLCETRCPYGLDIMARMEKIKQIFGE